MGQNLTLPYGPYNVTNFISSGCYTTSTEPCAWSFNVNFVPDPQFPVGYTYATETAFNVSCVSGDPNSNESIVCGNLSGFGWVFATMKPVDDGQSLLTVSHRQYTTLISPFPCLP
jgi:hypothetical protein